MKKKKIRISTVLLLVLLFVLLCVVAGAGWKLYRYYADYSKDRDLYSDLRDEVIKSEEKENEAEETTKDYLKTTEEYLENGGKKYRKKRKRISKSAPISVDWDELKEINEDIIGWVYFLQDCRRYLILFCRLMTMNIMCIELTTCRVIPQKQAAFLWTTVWQMIFHHHTLLSMVIMFVMVRCCQIWLGLKIKPYTMKNHISGF